LFNFCLSTGVNVVFTIIKLTGAEHQMEILVKYLICVI
jgi:hypothetical protein